MLHTPPFTFLGDATHQAICLLSLDKITNNHLSSPCFIIDIHYFHADGLFLKTVIDQNK
jgi:hypothetical protein